MTSPDCGYDGTPIPLLGNSRAVRGLREAIQVLAPTPYPVLVTGPTGTGKSAVARALHKAGGRRGPFIDGSATQLDAGTAVAELRGYSRGAFTGAERDTPGLFEQAHGGTLFLDEIGDAAWSVQRLLLTMLDGRPIRRIGDHRDRLVDVRIISATNRDLSARIRRGRFRRDLFHRLRVFHIHLPPLRERLADLKHLIPSLLARHARVLDRPVPDLSREVLDALNRYAYPGNIRDLDAALAHIMVAGRLPDWFCEPKGDWKDQLDDVLRVANGNISEVARRFGKHRRTIYRALNERRSLREDANAADETSAAM